MGRSRGNGPGCQSKRRIILKILSKRWTCRPVLHCHFQSWPFITSFQPWLEYILQIYFGSDEHHIIEELYAFLLFAIRGIYVRFNDQKSFKYSYIPPEERVFCGSFTCGGRHSVTFKFSTMNVPRFPWIGASEEASATRYESNRPTWHTIHGINVCILLSHCLLIDSRQKQPRD